MGMILPLARRDIRLIRRTIGRDHSQVTGPPVSATWLGVGQSAAPPTGSNQKSSPGQKHHHHDCSGKVRDLLVKNTRRKLNNREKRKGGRFV